MSCTATCQTQYGHPPRLLFILVHLITCIQHENRGLILKFTIQIRILGDSDQIIIHGSQNISNLVHLEYW
jgi:hypothetical protein